MYHVFHGMKPARSSNLWVQYSATDSLADCLLLTLRSDDVNQIRFWQN